MAHDRAMGGRQRRGTVWLAWSLFALIVLLFAIALGLLVIDWSAAQHRDFVVLVPLAGFGLEVVYPLIGALIVSRQPRNLIGWLMCATGLVMVVGNLAGAYALRGLVASPGSLPGALVMAWLQSWLPFVWFPALVIALLVLFPDGRPPSRRWWLVVGIAIFASLQQIATAVLTPHPLTPMNGGQAVLSQANPTAIASPTLISLLRALQLSIGLAILGAGAALIVRFRRASGDEREQTKWVVYVGSLLVAVLLVGGFATKLHPLVGVIAFLLWVSLFAIGIPIAMGLAILKYRLYDIDLIINKSLVYGALAVFITGIYIGIVAGVGSLIGSGGRPSLALSIVATAVVAVAFQPVRERVELLANWLVYGKRATPYEVLAQFTHRISGAYASEEFLPRMAQVLAEGTGAVRTDVWLRAGDQITPAASWPSADSRVPESVAIGGQLLPTMTDVTHVVSVRHQGELLGAISVKKRPGEALTPVEDGLLKSLASQAGLVLRNVKLTAELRSRLSEISAQASELRASRQRIVAAQDAERRRLERNIHDGAQQNLVALTVKLRLALNQAKTSPARAADAVRGLETEAAQALQTLRDLARGIYPPMLHERGLVAALKAQAVKVPARVKILADDVSRQAPDIEATIYFCCLEALQNATKHAAASNILVKLERQGDDVLFSVVDDGVGIDERTAISGSGLQNMKDRVEALGGRLTVGGAPGAGTRVTGRIPATIGVLHA